MYLFFFLKKTVKSLDILTLSFEWVSASKRLSGTVCIYIFICKLMLVADVIFFNGDFIILLSFRL